MDWIKSNFNFIYKSLKFICILHAVALKFFMCYFFYEHNFVLWARVLLGKKVSVKSCSCTILYLRNAWGNFIMLNFGLNCSADRKSCLFLWANRTSVSAALVLWQLVGFFSWETGMNSVTPLTIRESGKMPASWSQVSRWEDICDWFSWMRIYI